LQILSYFPPIILDTVASQEFYSIVLTCRRLYKVALPFLYRGLNCVWHNIELSLREYSAFKNFLITINTYPERAAWFQSVSFSWHEMSTKTWGTIFQFCSRLSSMHTLKLHVLCENGLYNGAGRALGIRSLEEICFSKLLHYPSLHHLSKLPLKNVIVNDARTTPMDVRSLYTLPMARKPNY
jgi:hypothetical protein